MSRQHEGTVTRGVVAGLWGVAAMAGVITTLRRALVPPDHMVTTHPEKVIERARQLAGSSGELDVQTRRRLGDLLHFAFGALWGVAYATKTGRHDIDPLIGGPLTGAALWAVGFCGYMPILGIQPGPWHWHRREFVLTGSAHLAYGTTMAMILRALQHRSQAPDS